MKFQIGSLSFILLFLASSAQNEKKFRVPNTVMWLERLSICTSNGTFALNLTVKKEILQDCTLKFASLYKNGTVLPHTFTVFDLNRTDNRYFLYKKRELRLEKFKLKAIHAFAINIPELEGLNLKHNDLNETTVHVDALEMVRNLRFLDLSHNKFETIPDKLIRNLFSLEYLNMSFNLLKSFQFGFGFNQHFRFTTIDLSNNKRVSQIGSADFNLLRGNKIEVFNVSSCSLSKVNSGVFAKFYHLREFSIDNNVQLNYESFRNLLHAWSQKMEYLNFNNLNLAFNSRYNSMDLVLSRFERTLKYLHMAGNNVILSDNKDFFENKLRNYKQLEVLNLNMNRNLFSANGLLNLSLNANLSELRLSGVGLGSLERVVLNQKIQYLDLSLNQLDTLGNFSINEYQFLNKLNLSNNQFQNLSSIFQKCENSTTTTPLRLDISNNLNLVLNSEDIKCFFKRKAKVNFTNIKGIKCDSELVNVMRQLSNSQISSLSKVQCTSVDIKLTVCSKQRNKIGIKAGDFGKDC